jgi:hypothetical protein
MDVIATMNGQNASIIIGYAGPDVLEAAFIKIDGIPGEIITKHDLINTLMQECYI